MTEANISIGRPYRRRSLFSALSMVILRPVQFFRELPAPSATRQWLFMAILLLALSAFTVNYISPVKPETTQDQWTVVLLTLAQVLAMWFGAAVVLMLVSLFQGKRPRFGHNLQLAIWATVPLGVMAVLQIIYVASGGVINSRGIARVIFNMEAYAAWSPTAQQLALSLAMHMHLFAVWHLALLFIGTQHVLGGRRVIIVLVLLVWVLVAVVMPIPLGLVQPPADPVPVDMGGEFPPGGEPLFPDGGGEPIPPDGNFVPTIEDEIIVP